MEQKARNNQMIEVCRGILCLLVVFCHFEIGGSLNISVFAAARCAVPFFLILSGFYSYRENSEQCIAATKKKMVDMLRLILKIAVLYTIVNTVVCAINGEPLFTWFTAKYLSMEALRNFLLFNRARFFCSVAYYLFMVLYVFAVYLPVVRLRIVKYSFFAIPVLLAGNIVLSEILQKDWFMAGNWIFTGIPFFLLGVFFAYKQIKPKRSYCIAMAAGGFVLTEIEANLIKNADVYLYVGTVLLSTGLFLLCQSCGEKKMPKLLTAFGSRYSMGIFVYHCAVGYILTALFEKAGLPVNASMPFIVIAATVIILAVFQNKKVPKKVTA